MSNIRQKANSAPFMGAEIRSVNITRNDNVIFATKEGREIYRESFKTNAAARRVMATI